MFGRQPLELRLAGVEPRDQIPDPFVEARAVAVVDGEDEPTLLDVGSQQLHLGIGESWARRGR